MAYIKQVIKGKSVASLTVEATAGDLSSLTALLEGQVTTFDEKASGGSVAVYPLALNRKKMSCGDKTTKVSCSFTIPHAKAAARISQIESVVIGAFDASYDVTTKASYANLLYDKN